MKIFKSAINLQFLLLDKSEVLVKKQCSQAFVWQVIIL